MDDDPAASPLDRYEVLMQLVDAYRWTADWPELVARSSRRCRSPSRSVTSSWSPQAAISTTVGALWHPPATVGCTPR